MVAISLRPSIILVGDSLTQFAFGQNGQVGWAQLLAQAYARRADVYNRGFQGYNSKMLLQIMPNLLNAGEAEDGQDVPVLFWTLYLGANDAALSSGRDSVPPEEFSSNLNEIVALLRQQESSSTACQSDESAPENDEDQTCQSSSPEPTPIILMTPPSCDVNLWRQLDPEDTNVPGNGNEIYKSYRDQVIQVAAQHANCSVLDTWSLLGGDEDAKLSESGYHTDGVHLTAKGNRVVFQGLMDLIRQDYPHLKPMTDGNGQYGTEGVPMEGKLWWMYN